MNLWKSAIPSAFTAGSFSILGWRLGSLLHLSGVRLWVFRGSLLTLGLAIATLLFFYLRSRRRRPTAAVSEAEREIDAALAAAQQRLREAQRGGKLGSLPLLLFLGPSGSTKSTSILRSGLEPELLAGEVHRGDTVIPTAGVNVWYAQDAIIVEAGGAVLAEPSRWSRLVGHLQPQRIGAVFARGAQAPRRVVVCFSCEEFFKPGSSEAVPAAARKLRGQLQEMAERLGVQLPVYVLFTKADRVPHFADYVRSLAREEPDAVLGATLPLASGSQGGSFAEREAARLQEAFRGIVHALSLRRLDIMPREQSELVRSGAYEFPRELSKVTDLAVQFLLDLCKPSHLGVSPFLRGFYLSGVRAVMVSDSASAPPSVTAAPQVQLGATSVFSAPVLPGSAPTAVSASGTRKVPEWVFLRGIFRDVILRDEVARRMTAGGTRVNFMRRTLLASAAGFFFLLSVGFATSYLNNRALLRSALAAAREVAPLELSGAEAPTVDALRRLDGLRGEAERLGRYQRERRPLRLAFGLFSGEGAQQELRRLYFQRFERLLWGSARADLLASLQALPAAPNATSDYGAAYDALKAHLITTSNPQESTPALLTPIVLEHWQLGRGLDEERRTLVQRQLDFFASELPYGNPYSDAPDAPVVRQARSYLQSFEGVDQLYQVLLAEAGKAAPAVQFNRMVPGSEAVVRAPHEVPGAFTPKGWSFVQQSLKDVDRLFSREQWVVGDRVLPPADRAKLAAELRARYVRDYITEWRTYLDQATVAGVGSADDGARTLARLSGNQSPLLQMLAIASQNTAVDSVLIDPAFQPVHAVVPPDAREKYVGPTNQSYVQAMVGLQSALDQAAKAPAPMRGGMLSQASGAAEQVRLAVREMAQGFTVEGQAQAVGAAVQRLLQAPVNGIDGLARDAPVAEVNGKGAQFCRNFGAIMAKYPFNPASHAEASVEDVAAAFQPGKSMLDVLYQDALQELLVPQGTRYGRRLGATPVVSEGFLSFFNRATAASRAFYSGGNSGPEVAFTFKPQTTPELPEVTATVDGRRYTFTRTMAAGRVIVWDGSQGREVKITGRVNGTEVTLAEAPSGTWALFRLFQQSEWQSAGGNSYTVRWRSGAASLSADVTMETPILQPGFLRLGCVARIAQ
jgi:type VI secretion system protein ImpL